MIEISGKPINLLKKIVIYLYKKLGCDYSDMLVDIPDTVNIECVISTPEFKKSKVHKMRVQQGTFFRDTLIFHPYPNNSIVKRGYNVNFQSFEDFHKSVIKVL
jgi:hypothetical protein